MKKQSKKYLDKPIQENETILKVENLEVNYGMIKAIKGISFEVKKGEIVALIGANGAGKTTTMHAISGLIPVKGGSIIYNAEETKKVKTKDSEGHTIVNEYQQGVELELTKIPGSKIVSYGLSQVPEGRRVFGELTVKDNLILGAYTRKDKEEFDATLEDVYKKFPILKERTNQEASTMSGGEQQMLAVARALMSHPKVLLLDEPSMGLSPLYVDIIFNTIKEINKEGTTILLVEQNAKKALSIADRAYVIETGSIAKEGTGSELLNDEEVKKAYLGQ